MVERDGNWSHILHRVHVEINLIGNSEPHMSLCPPSHALDVEVVIDVDVIGGAVAAAGAASEGEGRAPGRCKPRPARRLSLANSR